MLFKNDSEKGAFGEFVYQRYIRSLPGFRIEPRRICEHDFYVRNELGVEFRVDVKTTTRDLTRYMGRKGSENISYDLVVIRDERVRLFPDSSSPVAQKEILIDDVRSLYKAWKETKLAAREKGTKEQSAAVLSIKRQIYEYGEKHDLRFRLIHRGPASNTKWGKRRPDNVIPKSKDRSKYDFTIFIQMQCVNFNEVLESLYIFRHESLDEIPTFPADRRQQRKGICRVIDLDEYGKGFPESIFDSMPALFVFLNDGISKSR